MGWYPGRTRPPEELVGIGRALGEAGHGVFEMVSDLQGQEPDLTWMKEFCATTGRVITFALAQTPIQPTAWRETLDRIDAPGGARTADRAAGADAPDRHALRSAELVSIRSSRIRRMSASSPRCRSTNASPVCAIRKCGRPC
jgi:hypothetical protein